MYLDKFFNPQSVAIIGATEDPQNITSTIIQNLFEMDFKGSVVPVNPHHDKVFGLKCYPSLLILMIIGNSTYEDERCGLRVTS